MKHSGYLTTSGAEIYYEQYGCGTPLLILHGNSQSLAVFYPFLRTFLPDFQVILMDSRGHGRSRLSVHTALHGFSTEDMADDVIALLNHLHLSSVHLLGFSDGANIGLEIACKYPERLKTLICISANASPDGLLTPLYLAAQMLHSILNLLGNLLLPVLKCSFSSASAYPAWKQPVPCRLLPISAHVSARFSGDSDGQPGTWAFPAVCPHSAPRVLYRGYGRRRYRPA